MAHPCGPSQAAALTQPLDGVKLAQVYDSMTLPLSQNARGRIEEPTMSLTRQIKLGLFVRPAGNHIASWRHPDSHADAGANFQRSVEMARTAERGLFDMLFSADTQSAWTAEGEGMRR